jgi:PAS domain S-box-containing protein
MINLHIMDLEESDITNPLNLRAKAEQILLQKKEKALLDREFKPDITKLVHELQVHQIELEMQHEELLNACEIAEAALKKFTLVYNLAPIGFMTIAPDGIITDLNFPAAEMLGERRFELVGSNFIMHIKNESRSDFNSFLQKTFESCHKETCRLFFSNQPSHLIYIEGIVIENDNKCMLSLVDINFFIQ